MALKRTEGDLYHFRLAKIGSVVRGNRRAHEGENSRHGSRVEVQIDARCHQES